MKTQQLSVDERYGTMVAPGTFKIVRLLPGPIERVWAFVTESEKRGQWLASGPMELRIGGRVELIFRHSRLMLEGEEIPEKYREMCGEGDVMIGHVTRCEPPNLLSFTWQEEDEEASEVSFELTLEGSGVRFELTHRKLTHGLDTLSSLAAGWHTHTDILVAELEGSSQDPFWSKLLGLDEDYGKRLADQV